MKRAIIIIPAFLAVAFLLWAIGFDHFWGKVLSGIINLVGKIGDFQATTAKKGDVSLLVLQKGSALFNQKTSDLAFSALALFGWQAILLFYLPLKKWLRTFLINIPILLLLQILFITVALPLSTKTVAALDFYITILPNFIIFILFLILKDLAIEKPEFRRRIK